ncbi:MAG: phosphotransferase [Lachnospiraceae bacterium]|nr:phosphotransferase [Lachnospiraceae bacterium]
MKEIIEQLLPLWGIESGHVSQIYSSAWEIDHSYVVKIYHDQEQLERNIRLLSILQHCDIPVAEILCTKAGETYVTHQNAFFLLSKKLPGSSVTDLKDKTMAWKMGCAIARLHTAFLQCEQEIAFWNNSFLDEMKGWVRENLNSNDWQLISEAEYLAAVSKLELLYDSLPRQLIHRDVHFENFLFLDGDFSGYIDFDLSQKNIRVFDICYFLTGLLAEETAEPFTKTEWLALTRAVTDGYESVTGLSEAERSAIPCVMQCIEILFAAYFIGSGEIHYANGARDIFHFVQDCEEALTIL